MKTLLALGAIANIGQFILLVWTVWRSYRTDLPLETVWEHHPHENNPNVK
jgi:hypothetical protein